MIYIGIAENHQEEIMQYAALTTVMYNEEQIFSAVFQQDDCSVLCLTDSFIQKKLRPEALPMLLHEMRRVRPTLSIVLIGPKIVYDGQDAHVLPIPWFSAQETIPQVEKAVSKPLVVSKAPTTVYDDLVFNLNHPDLLLYYIINNEATILPFLREVLTVYTESTNSVLSLQAAVDTLTIENMAIDAERRQLALEHANLMLNYNSLNTAYSTLYDKITRQYDITFAKDGELGYRVENNRYRKVLYIKELTRVHYVDSLLYYVQSLLNTVYATPTRFIVIEKPYSTFSASYYPNHTLSTQLTYGDLKTRDFIMCGYQKDLIASLMQNPSQRNYCIVLDRSGHDFRAISGDKVVNLFTLSDLKDKSPDIPNDIVISYSEATHTIPHIPNFDRMSDGEKIVAYSTLPITKSIINALEGVSYAPDRSGGTATAEG